MNDMNPAAAAPQRPTLLTVICILSFIMGLFSLWSGYRNAFTDAPQEALLEAKAQMEESMAQLGDQGTPMVQEMLESAITLAEKSVEKAKPMGYAEIVVALLSLFGVWSMWNLRKMGFWVYLLASIAGLAMPVVFLGGGLMTMLSVGIGGFISIVFIILYAVNLKHMH